MSYNRIWIHANFSTKDRRRLITSSAEEKIHNYLSDQLKQCGCIPKIINGTADHVHLLFLANPKIAMTDVFKQIKGSSSHWINANKLSSVRFCWQDGFAAFTISESQVDKVYQYIANQKEHHARKSFTEELSELVAAYGLTLETPRKGNG
ncbi:MAG TPA: IS200/IS605 family transposase [Bacteroidia bacterium]|nr:IS200/IS605 family transposase [Bacteroidia bacterium]